MIIGLDKKRMPRETMLAKIEDDLKTGGENDPPAYTLILGAGASFGVVPTAKEMLGFPDVKTGKIHENSIPLWLARQRDPEADFNGDDARLAHSKGFWQKFRADNSGNSKCAGIDIGADGLPKFDSIAAAYKAVFETSCIGGLSTPERHRNYMRAVTMAVDPGSMRLNATHFYLASLLSLQKRSGEPGASGKPLYTGRREFARTIFTTNFDPLLQTSLQLFQLLYYMTDRPEFLSADALQTDHHPAIHLFYAHGSVHRPYMANTDEQIELLKKQNARDLAAYLGNHGVIVLGYSGWDDCLLEALNQTKIFSNNLYWLARGADSISPSVAKFLDTHANAYWVQVDDGGSFMAELHGRLCPGAPNTEMLYNPIRPLLCQLGCVNLAGIQAGAAPKETGSEQGLSASEAPPDVEAIRLLTIARLEDAQKTFTETPKTNSSADELERQAELSYSNGDWTAALGCYHALLNRGSGITVQQKALALFRRGVCHGKLRQFDKAIEDYSTVIEMQGVPNDQVAKAQGNRGLCHGELKQFEKAIEDYSAVIDTPGASVDQIARARFNRGVCHRELKQTDQAIKNYSAVIDMPGAPVDLIAMARVNRGVCFTELEQFDKAIEDYSAVIDMPGAPIDQIAMARLNRGNRHRKLEQFDKAIEDQSAVIAMPGAPVDEIAMARFNRGLCYMDLKKNDEAVENFKAVIQMPEAPTNLVKRARELIKECDQSSAA